MAYFWKVTILLQYEMSAQHPSIKCLGGMQGRVPGSPENYRVCKLFKHCCIQRCFFFFSSLSWFSELGKGVSERILKTGIRSFRSRAVAFLCKWQIKWNALTVAPYVSLIFLQSIQGTKSPCLVWPSVGFQLYVLTENMWPRKCGLQITSDLSKERIAPVPYAKIPGLLLKLHTVPLKPMAALPSLESINCRVSKERRYVSRNG